MTSESQSRTMTQRMAAFVEQQRQDGLPPGVVHEAKRVLLNGLRATLEGSDQPVISMLREWAANGGSGARPARALWSPSLVLSEYAAMITAAEWTVLLQDARHPGTGQHPVGPAAGAALAEGDRLHVTGKEMLTAMVLAMEVELTFLMALMPSIRDRRLICISTAGALAAGVATAVLNGLDVERLASAIGIGAMTNIGLWEMGGTMSSYYNVGMSACAWVNAAHAARLGVNAPATAFEGEYGALRAYSDESLEKAGAAVQEMGSRWHIMELMMQRHSGDTVTQAPIDCVLQVRERTPEAKRKQVESMRFIVDPRAASMVASRTLKFGRPRTSLEANSDPRHGIAAAWVAGKFTDREKTEKFREDPEVLALRDRLQFESRGDPNARAYHRAELEVTFSDGTSDTALVEAVKGHFSNPLGDDEVVNQFKTAADGRLPAARIGEIVETVWGLEQLRDVADFVGLLVADQSKGS